ncbi:MAG TPA: NADPH:quinone reductase [Hyphomicrobiaceae bacterium]|nr:NADPH:quinone reductase [Hyphomicrobiaceae bacterium]
MKAAYYRGYGAAREVFELGELPDPEPGPGEVRVRVRYSGVNPSDCNRRSGSRDRPGYRLIIPHSDGAGEIDRVGAGVDKARIGERVWTWNAQRGRPFGTAAEFVCLPSAQAVPMPEAVDLALGAGFGVPAMTAYFSLFADGPLAGRDVLVTGAAGAVGLYAAQFAHLGGARSLIGTVSGEAKAAIARDAGVPVVVNYRQENVAERVLAATAGRGVDRISEVDFGGNLATILKVMREGTIVGTYASRGEEEPTLPYYPFLFANIVVRFVQCSLILGELREAGIRDLGRWSAEGRLRHPAPTILPISEIARAHELVESKRVIGKVILAL